MDTTDTLLEPVRAPPARLPRPARGQAERGRERWSEEREPALVLGRYRLLERLGAGGFGTVWSAEDELLRREVALKRIELPEEAREEGARATREALASARLAHPGIVALYEAREEDGAFYLISELVHGETLAALIAADTLGDERVLEIGLTLLDALAHAHARGVIHRDVKPQNILIPEDPAEPRGVA
ncbi:MAG TPA: serine/threonine-protein kinase, partial [Solirubrobacteraceae bacterium]|nr:serine/threonine-protein kinase [Solirubrobacteraceae bacterium]